MNYKKNKSGLLLPESYFLNKEKKEAGRTAKEVFKDELKQELDYFLSIFWDGSSKSKKLCGILLLAFLAIGGFAVAFNICTTLIESNKYNIIILYAFSFMFSILSFGMVTVIMRNWIILLKSIYLSFIIFATLCFIRITITLPLVLSNIKDGSVWDSYRRVATDSNKIDIDFFYFSSKIIYTFPSLVVLLFILSRLIIQIFLSGVFHEKAKTAIKYWNETLIWWAVIFTVCTTVSSQWGDYNAF